MLRHLEAVGFEGAPRFLGVDSRGREVLSYIPGTAVVEPYPDWALTDEALVSAAELLRAYHDAASTFDPSPYSWAPPPPEEFAGDLVTHNDTKIDNVVFRDGRAVGLIDFDLAGPASRAWDVACAARLWAPLRPDIHISDARRRRKFERFRLFVDSYGISDSDRMKVAEAVGQNYEWFYELIKTHAANGHSRFCGALERQDPAAGRTHPPVACREQVEPSQCARHPTVVNRADLHNEGLTGMTSHARENLAPRVGTVGAYMSGADLDLLSQVRTLAGRVTVSGASGRRALSRLVKARDLWGVDLDPGRLPHPRSRRSQPDAVRRRLAGPAGRDWACPRSGPMVSTSRRRT